MSTTDARTDGTNDANAGKVDMNLEAVVIAFSSAEDLAGALKRAEAAHGEHEKRTGERDEDWPAWYAAYMVAEATGSEPPT